MRFRITANRNLEKYREKLLEAVAETSEEFMERYFAGEEFSVEEIRAAMRTEVMEGESYRWLWDLIFRRRVLQFAV